MGISWKQFFDLIEKLYEVKESEIAVALEVNRSVISKLKNGKQQDSRLKAKDLYTKIFDIENKDSLTYKFHKGNNNLKLALDEMKEVIKETDLTEQVRMLDDSEYKSFVMKLIKLIDRGKNNQPNAFTNDLESSDLQSGSECKEISSDIIVPLECKICLCCENWKGNEINAYKSVNGVEGQCIMFDKNTLSVDGTNCKRFKACYGRISMFLNSQKIKNIYDLIF